MAPRGRAPDFRTILPEGCEQRGSSDHGAWPIRRATQASMVSGNEPRVSTKSNWKGASAQISGLMLMWRSTTGANAHLNRFPTYGVERAGEVRSAVADQESHVPEPVVEAEGEVAGLLHRALAGRAGGDAAQVHPAGAVRGGHPGRPSPAE